MFVVPVEKKGKYADSLSLRFLCFDPATRMAYLSDKGAKVREWKHRMTVYAVMPKCVQAGQEMDYRGCNFEARELLLFTLCGIAYSRLDRSDPACHAELRRLPKLLDEGHYDGTPSTGTAAGGVGAPSVTPAPTSDVVYAVNEGNFFGKGREDWTLRCRYYAATHDIVTRIRDTLIADGLCYPVHGGLRNGLDPRTGLRLVNLPLYLQFAFHQLVGAVVYTCLHGRMIGCAPHGRVGVCMRHVYLCVTDTDLLFVSEGGAVARSLPLSFLAAVEYRAPSDTAVPAGTPGPPFAAFLTIGDTADVLFTPCSAFAVDSDDCSTSMAAAMPRMNVGEEWSNLLHVLQTLRDHPPHSHGTSAPLAESPEALQVVVLPREQTAQDYAEGFEARHGRSFKWQPLPGGQHLTPTVQSAASVAASLGLPTPQRQAIARRSEFLPFYYGSQAAAKAAVEADSTAREARREQQARSPARHAGASAGVGGDSGGAELYSEDVYAIPSVPVRRVSKLIDMFKPEQDIY
ncbi:hypothetical protein NESM_000215100 [Novymonas esmeraldas]|uniref:Uncharacterized protein n=1 Tax=Novymonas esmeraldas TaxID=1808958 RepID=A0AAW0F9Q3_9TRYP